jgi:hypothetical protein
MNTPISHKTPAIKVQRCSISLREEYRIIFFAFHSEVQPGKADKADHSPAPTSEVRNALGFTFIHLSRQVTQAEGKL